MTVVVDRKYALSDVPFSLFAQNAQQASIHDLTEESKTFLWHQFMFDVLMHIPSSSMDKQNVIAACRLVNERDADDPVSLPENKIEHFLTNYHPDTAIKWYTKDSFFYRAFNKACRMLDCDAVVLFHPVVRDLDAQLKQLCSQQLANRTLTLPLTVYRGLREMNAEELKRIRENIGGLISMNTFLSTSLTCTVASDLISDANRETAVIFEITINEAEADNNMYTFADISQQSGMTDEREVLFGVSSVFRIVSVEQWDCHWFIELESTSYKEDPTMQTFLKDIQTYLHEQSGEQIPLTLGKQLLTVNSLSSARPWIEIMQFSFVQVIQLFLTEMYKNEGRMKMLIDNAPELQKFVGMTNEAVIPPNSRIICLIFDLLRDFFYPEDKQKRKKLFPDETGNLSLLCFGGFLLLTGDLNKGTRYFQMLLNHESIDNKLKIVIHGLLLASYSVTKEEELALKATETVETMLQSFTDQSMSDLYSTSMVMDDPNLLREPSIDGGQTENTIDGKFRLLHLGQICAKQNHFVHALNHWEEAVEIVSHMPSSVEAMLNGVIFVQMAPAYFRLNNRSDALRSIEQGIEHLKSFYSSTHRMFAGLYFIYGYYLIQNERPSEAIKHLKKCLENPHFFINHDFCAIVYTLLASASMQVGDLDSAETYCHQARQYPSTSFVTDQVPRLLELIPQLRMYVQYMGKDVLRQVITTGLQFGQQLISQIRPRSTARSGEDKEDTWSTGKLIATADHYRHQRNNERAEIYYSKALDKVSENESKVMWNIYRKMVRMDNDGSQYQNYFIEQFSKYDDTNPNHFLMIAIFQIILYKLNLSQNNHDMAFDCLISSVLIALKIFVHQANLDSQYIFNLVDQFVHDQSTAKLSDILTKIIEIYSADWIKQLQQFGSKYMNMDDLVALIRHPTIDCALAQVESKYDTDQFTKKNFRFLHILLQSLRENLPSTNTSKLSFAEQFLSLLGNYKEENSLWCNLIQALKSLCIGDINDFFINIDRFRFEVVTFERYQELKNQLCYILQGFDENRLYFYFENLINTP